MATPSLGNSAGQQALARALLRLRSQPGPTGGPSGIQQPGVPNPPNETGPKATGKDHNSGEDRWFIPDYSRGRVSEQDQQAATARQAAQNRAFERLMNLMNWRDNNPIAGRIGPEIRARDATWQIPQFADTGVDEGYMAFKNFMNYGTSYPGFSTYFGQGGYG